MIYIEMNGGYKTLIDDQDADLACYKWRTSCLKWGPYAYREEPMVKGVRGKCVSLSRTIAERMGMDLSNKAMQVDHRNGNPLDNRRDNLRLLSASDNSRNQKDRTDNTSGFKGVHYDRAREKWLAFIKTDGKMKHLGRFKTIEEAKTARLAAEESWSVQPRRGVG
jgi:hypothetical protein